MLALNLLVSIMISSCNLTAEDNMEGHFYTQSLSGNDNVSSQMVGQDTIPAEPSGNGDFKNLIYKVTFEEDDPFNEFHEQFGTKHAFSVTSEPSFRGGSSGRFELRNTDPMTSNGTRSEVLFPEQEHNERWYSFSLYLPADDFKVDSNNDIISQWHQGKGSGSPTTTLRVKDDRFFLKSGDTKETRKDYDIATVKKDVWNEFVIHIVHSSGDDGLVELWFNGDKVLNIKGGNMDEDFGLPRWKIGIYKDDWNYDETTDTDHRVMYFDNVLMGNENATYNEMSGKKSFE